MRFEELDDTTRKYMLEEFQKEEKGGNPYRSSRMSAEGLANVARHMEKAIKNGDENTLAVSLSNGTYWKPYETRRRKDTTYQAKIDPMSSAKTFALTEFNTWYVRGLAKRLIGEGQKECEVYRAESADQPRCECSRYEDQRLELQKIYDGHRAKYHPVPNYGAFSIPSGTNCHHTIRRIKQ